MPTILERKKAATDKRLKTIADFRAINEKAEKENRERNAEEKSTASNLMAEYNRIGDELKALEDEQRMEDWSKESQGLGSENDNPGDSRGDNDDDKEATLEDLEEKREPYHAQVFRHGREIPSMPRTRRHMRAYGNYLRRGYSTLADADRRDLQADNAVQGGYMVMPLQLQAQLIKQVDDLVHIRQYATKIPVPSAASLGCPTLEANPADADWTPEVGEIQVDTTMSVGRRELTPHQITKGVLVSSKLIRTSVLPVQQLVMDRLAYKFGITEEKAFLTGNGAGQPLGVFTATAQGIPTSRDVSTGNSATQIKPDGLIAAKYALKASYRKTARWLFHRDAVAQIMAQKDAEGRYIWQPSLVEDQPDRLLNLPILESEYAPNTFTTGQYVGILADWSHYWIADALSMSVQVLIELYAKTGQIAYFGKQEMDGMPTLAEAFVRVKLG